MQFYSVRDDAVESSVTLQSKMLPVQSKKHMVLHSNGNKKEPKGSFLSCCIVWLFHVLTYRKAHLIRFPKQMSHYR